MGDRSIGRWVGVALGLMLTVVGIRLLTAPVTLLGDAEGYADVWGLEFEGVPLPVDAIEATISLDSATGAVEVAGRGADLPSPMADVALGDEVSIATINPEVEITITDPAGQVIKRLQGADTFAVASFTLDEAGRYEIHVALPADAEPTDPGYLSVVQVSRTRPSGGSVEVAPWEDASAGTIGALWLLAGIGTALTAATGATGRAARGAGLLTVAAGASVALGLHMSSTWRQFYWLRSGVEPLVAASLVACFIGATAWGGAPPGTRLKPAGCMAAVIIVLAGLLGALTVVLVMGSSESYRETVAAGMDGSDYMFLELHESLFPWALALAAIAGTLVAPSVTSRDTEPTGR